MTTTIVPRSATTAECPADVAAVYAIHGDFVWASLQRLGVHGADLHDVLQEVFLVVHRRLHTFAGNASMTTWLFGICLRVVAGYRRRAHRRRERLSEGVIEQAGPDGDNPESAAIAGQACKRLNAILDELDLERRAVFVMFEIDEMSCEEIATTLGVPVGTVYSRLHRARKDVERVAARWKARDVYRGK